MSCMIESIQPGRKCPICFPQFSGSLEQRPDTAQAGGIRLDLAKASGRADSCRENQKNIKRTLKDAVAE